MDWIGLKEKTTGFLKKHAYVIVILCVGLVLMMIPSKQEMQTQQPVIQEQKESILTLEQRLSQILCKVAGAGEVQVILSVASGEETVYQTDDDYSTANESSTGRKDTVTVTDSDRNEAGLVRQINPPVYLGAVVVCEGADSPSVRLAIVEAVADVTGIGADKISVLKMK